MVVRHNPLHRERSDAVEGFEPAFEIGLEILDVLKSDV
jgi:hypothetical protein